MVSLVSGSFPRSAEQAADAIPDSRRRGTKGPSTSGPLERLLHGPIYVDRADQLDSVFDLLFPCLESQ